MRKGHLCEIWGLESCLRWSLDLFVFAALGPYFYFASRKAFMVGNFLAFAQIIPLAILLRNIATG